MSITKNSLLMYFMIFIALIVCAIGFIPSTKLAIQNKSEAVFAAGDSMITISDSTNGGLTYMAEADSNLTKETDNSFSFNKGTAESEITIKLGVMGTAGRGYTQLRNLNITFSDGTTTLSANRTTADDVVYYELTTSNINGNAITATVDVDTNQYSCSVISGSNFTVTSGTNSKITHNESYTFGIQLSNQYRQNYPVVTYTMNGQPYTYQGTPTDSLNSTLYYTISNVTGNISVTIQPNPNTYTFTTQAGSNATISITSGTTGSGSSYTATYGQNINFTVTVTQFYSNQPTVTLNSIAGTYLTYLGNEGLVYSYQINGAGITNNFSIEATANANTYTLTQNNTGTSLSNIQGVSGSTSTITYGTDISFRVTGTGNYSQLRNLVVSYTVASGTAIILTASDDTYTIPGTSVTGNITITTSATLNEFDITITNNANSGDTYCEFAMISGFIIDGNDKRAQYNSTIKFSIVAIDSNYNYSISVSGGTSIPLGNNVYQITVTQNIIITITKTAKTFIFTPSTGTGYTLTTTAGVSGSIITYGTTIAFRITIESGYQISDTSNFVSYSLGGATPVQLSTPTASGNSYNYTINGNNVTNNIQIFVNGVGTSAYTVRNLASTTYYSFNGSTSISYGSSYTFTITLASNYTQLDASTTQLIQYTMNSSTTQLTGTRISGTNTYTYTIDNVLGDITIDKTSTGWKLNTYTITVTNNNYYSSWRSRYFSFLFSINTTLDYNPNNLNRTRVEYSADSEYASKTYSFPADTLITLRVYSYEDSGNATETVLVRNISTNQTSKYSDANSASTYNLSNLTSNLEITITLASQSSTIHLPTEFETSSSSFPSGYSTQLPVSVPESGIIGPVTINTQAGYSIETTSQTVLESGSYFTFQVNVLTSQGFNSSSMIVRYWTKNRSTGSFQSNTLNVSNGSYSIYIAQNYSDYYISITGITRDSYNISQPSGNGFNFYSSISNNQTYGNTYSFSITVDADHGWYCSNGNDDTDDFGSPVVSYSVNGSPVTTSLTATGSSSVGGSSSNITFTYEFVVTGITQLYVSGLAQKTYTVYVIYVDMGNNEFQTERGVVTPPSGYTAGQIVPISGVEVAYGGSFNFSLYVNTAEGWNGNAATISAKPYSYSDTNWDTLVQQTDGSYIYSGVSGGIYEDFIIKVSGITSDSYYVTFPTTQGVFIERGSDYESNTVQKGSDFGFTVTLNSNEGWEEVETGIVVKYYTITTQDNENNWITLTKDADLSTETVYYYKLTNISSNIFIYIDTNSIKQISFSVKAPDATDGVTTNISSTHTVVFGQNYTFKVTVETGYDPSTLYVYYTMENRTDEPTLISGTSGSYTIANVIGNLVITFSEVEKYYFTATIPQNGTGYPFTMTLQTLNSSTDDINHIEYGGYLSYSITLNSGYAYTNGTSFVVTLRRAGIVGTETIPITTGTSTYNITNITSNIEIEVSGYKLLTYTVTFVNNPVGYSIIPEGASLVDNVATVNYGDKFYFQISINTSQGYNGDALSVSDNVLGALSSSNGRYTVTNFNSSVDVGIIQNHQITITGIEISTYTVTLPSNTSGYTIEANETSINYGGNLTFTVNLLEGYKADNLSVRASVGGQASREIEPNEDNIYSITNITGNVIISVSGVEQKTYSITFPTDEGWTYNKVDGEVVHGNSYSFSININTSEGYYEQSTGLKVSYQVKNEETGEYGVAQTLTPTKGVYTITNITSDINIVINGITRDAYSITVPAGDGFTIRKPDGTSFVTSDLTDIDFGSSFDFNVEISTGTGYYASSSYKVYYTSTSLTTTTYLTAEPEQQPNGNIIYKYNITNITGNITIYVTGIVIQTYTVYIPSNLEQIGYKFYTSFSTTVNYGKNFQFSINVETNNGYNENSLVVYYQEGSTTKQRINPYSGNNFEISNIKSNITVTVDPISKLVYNITLPTGNGYQAKVETDYSTSVTHGNNFKFSILILSENGYNSNNMKVGYTTDGINITPLTEEDGIYTIDSVTSNISISVTGVQLNKYNINFPTELIGATIWNSTGVDELLQIETVTHGDNFEFKVILDELYNKANITVYSNGIMLNKNAKNNYIIRTITSDCNITISNLIMNKAVYTVLDNTIAKELPYEVSYYTEESMLNYTTAVKNAQSIDRNLYQDSQNIIENAIVAVTNAYNALQLKTADYSALNELISKIPSDLYQYTEESREALTTAVNMVVSGLTIDQQNIVDGYASVIEKSILNLVVIGEQPETGVPTWVVITIGAGTGCLIFIILLISLINRKRPLKEISINTTKQVAQLKKDSVSPNIKTQPKQKTSNDKIDLSKNNQINANNTNINYNSQYQNFNNQNVYQQNQQQNTNNYNSNMQYNPYNQNNNMNNNKNNNTNNS